MTAQFVGDIWNKYHSWYFKTASNFTRLTARKITKIFLMELSLVKVLLAKENKMGKEKKRKAAMREIWW